MKIYTIGFTQKSAESFFTMIHMNGISLLVDIRLRPDGQLSGFSRSRDMPYLLCNLSKGCHYVHRPDMAPSKEMREQYHGTHDWQLFDKQYDVLMNERGIPSRGDLVSFQENKCCLLCSEHSPQKCHRRLLAERLAAMWPNVEIVHL